MNLNEQGRNYGYGSPIRKATAYGQYGRGHTGGYHRRVVSQGITGNYYQHE